MRRGVYLDFRDAIKRVGKKAIEERYGNLFEMYQRITGDDPYQVPMRIYPATHYTMGGLWVDYNLESTIPGLFVGGEANFSDHGANRLGASALMQGLADGYFVLPYTVGNYLGQTKLDKVDAEHPDVKHAVKEVEDRIEKLLSIGGDRSPDSFHRELGHIIWDHCGMSRTKEGLEKALEKIPALARGVLEEPAGDRHRRGAEPGAREGWARGGLPRARRVDVSRRPGARRVGWVATSARSTRPTRARPSATTRTSSTSPPGSSTARATSRSYTRSGSSSSS